jgi:hypothetical protein
MRNSLDDYFSPFEVLLEKVEERLEDSLAGVSDTLGEIQQARKVGDIDTAGSDKAVGLIEEALELVQRASDLYQEELVRFEMKRQV